MEFRNQTFFLLNFENEFLQSGILIVECQRPVLLKYKYIFAELIIILQNTFDFDLLIGGLSCLKFNNLKNS